MSSAAEGGSRLSVFPDLFSFSFDPEILSLFWSSYGSSSSNPTPKDSVNYDRIVSSSSLLNLFLLPKKERSGFFPFVKFTVITLGLISCVGVSSYGVFKTLQLIRHEGIPGLRMSVNHYLQKIRGSTAYFTFQNLELVFSRRSEVKTATKKNIQRPCGLEFHPPGNGVNSTRKKFLAHPKNVRMVSGSPLAGDVASGDEEISNIRPQYFGPHDEMRTPSRSVTSTPNTPETWLRAKYEKLNEAQDLDCQP